MTTAVPRDHRHTFTESALPSHDRSILGKTAGPPSGTIGNTGNRVAVDTRLPYHALAFIMAAYSAAPARGSRQRAVERAIDAHGKPQDPERVGRGNLAVVVHVAADQGAGA